METTKTNKGFSQWVRTSITARMLMVGGIVLVLLIPLIFVKGLINERSVRQQDVVNEVGSLWGKEVLVMGPVLKVPYRLYTESTKVISDTKKIITERKAQTKYAYFFPDALQLHAKVDAVKKERGIYETSVFSSTLDFSGHFGTPNFKENDINPEDVDWDKATILIRTSNLKGIKNEVVVQLGDQSTTLLSRYRKSSANEQQHYNTLTLHELESAFLGKTTLTEKGNTPFKLQMTVNGSRRLRFVPIGKNTELTMTSNWKDPSFTGSFLPEEDENKRITDEGFTAHWKVLQTNRRFGQSFLGSIPNLVDFAFGTELLVPVDEYQKSERSVKYGYLVITLTLLVFFLIQTISTISIHPFQYLMIGLALVLFYTLLISISEHQNFFSAYLIAGIAVVMLISTYSRSILKNNKFVLLIFSSLSALYAFIFVIIQLESYALLVGSIGLFVILATTMFASRKIDWAHS
ncbi:MAG: cell envelope integrity protein CreD [Bacteroidota bacterium]